MDTDGPVPLEKLRGRKIGKILWRLDKVSEEQLKDALVRQQREGGARLLGQILVDMGLFSELDVKEALAAQNGTEVVISRTDLKPVRGPAANRGGDAEDADLVPAPAGAGKSDLLTGAGKSGGGGSAAKSGAIKSGKFPSGPAGSSPSGEGAAVAGDGGESGEDKLKGRRLGKILWRLGLINEEKLKDALVRQQRSGGATLLGQVLVEMGACSQDDIDAALAAQAGESYTLPKKAAGAGRSGKSPVASKPAPAGDGPMPDTLSDGSLDLGSEIAGGSGKMSVTGGPAGDDLNLAMPDFSLDDVLGINKGKPGGGSQSAGGSGDGAGAAAVKPIMPEKKAGRAARKAAASADETQTGEGAAAAAGGDAGADGLAKLKGRKLGKILWRLGKVSEEQLKESLVRQLSSKSGGLLGGILVELGYCTVDDVREALAAQKGVSTDQLGEVSIEIDRSTGEAADAGGGDDDGGAPGGPVPIEKLKGRKIGKILWRLGKVSLPQIKEAILQQKQTRSGMLGQILVRMGYCTEQDVQQSLAAQLGIETIDLRGVELSKEIIDKITPQTANLYRVIPLEYQETGKVLKVALDSPDNFQATDDLRTLFGFNVRPVIIDAGTMDALLNKYYGETGGELQNIMEQLSADQELAAFQGRGESIDITEMAQLVESQPVKKLLNLVLLQAIKDRASDIHFEPFEDEFKMRYRVDGILYEMVPPPKHIALALASRVKVMANLDIAERRLPQDGRIALTVHGRAVDLRVSVLPTMFGESVVMRVLDRSNVSLDLNKLGMREQDLNIFRQLIRRPNGICVVTGPTGSGKTTTLYSALNELNDISSKLITCEDPVEYDIDGIIQVQIQHDVGMTFAKALRAILRQDPDVCLVGECRDLETAQISVQAALTGHLVFTTLHTNDAPSAIARLLDMGLQPYLITAVVEGILAQRLVRKICQNCRMEYTPTEENLFELELRPEDIAGRTFYVGRGCDFCNNTGYKGRLAIHEIMLLDDDLRELIMTRASTNIIRNEARKRGMRNLRESGLLAIYDGLTTVEEVVKETVMDE